MIGRRWWAPWLWLAPAITLLSVFLIYPVVDTLRRSLLNADSTRFVGFDNYKFIIDNPVPLLSNTHSAILNNVLWLVLFTSFAVGVGLGIALLASRVRYEAVAKSAIFIPMAVSFVAASVIWRFMYVFDPHIGTINAFITHFGGHSTAWIQNTNAPQTWLTSLGPTTLPDPIQINNLALIIVGVWVWTGFAVVVLSAGLRAISSEMLQAARVDGANEWQIFRRIIIPVLSPTIAVVATTLVIQALKLFDLVWVMTGGKFKTDVIATLFFREAFLIQDFGVGSALAIVLLLAVVPVMVVSIRRFQFQEETR
ncbi:MAG: sugar ABC transporter permease [Chloroflexota bacterium]|nr:sugar ABC transporter permease [Chloroflexota bacterium]